MSVLISMAYCISAMIYQQVLRIEGEEEVAYGALRSQSINHGQALRCESCMGNTEKRKAQRYVNCLHVEVLMSKSQKARKKTSASGSLVGNVFKYLLRPMYICTTCSSARHLPHGEFNNSISTLSRRGKGDTNPTEHTVTPSVDESISKSFLVGSKNSNNSWHRSTCYHSCRRLTAVCST